MPIVKRATAIHSGRVLQGIAAGALAGVVGAWIMSGFQRLLLKAMTRSAHEAHDEETQGSDSSEPTTVKTAVALSRRVFHHELTPQQREIAGPLVHYAFGTSVGAFYGGLAEVIPSVTAARGLPAATILWLVADETMLPLVGLSGPPWKYPLFIHVYGLASHLVYGVFTESFRRVLRHR